MKKRRITDLDSLDRSIWEMEQKQLMMEDRLNDNWKYLKNNYGSIFRTSILRTTQTEGRSSFIYWLFSIPQFKSTVGKTAEKLTVKLENLVVKWIDKLTE